MKFFTFQTFLSIFHLDLMTVKKKTKRKKRQMPEQQQLD